MPTEATIALSIVLLATEIVHKRNGRIGLTERSPWLIASIFGLFHGLSFAGAGHLQCRCRKRAPVVYRCRVELDRSAETLSAHRTARRLARRALQHWRRGGLLDDLAGDVFPASRGVGRSQLGMKCSPRTQPSQAGSRSTGGLVS